MRTFHPRFPHSDMQAVNWPLREGDAMSSRKPEKTKIEPGRKNLKLHKETLRDLTAAGRQAAGVQGGGGKTAYTTRC